MCVCVRVFMGLQLYLWGNVVIMHIMQAVKGSHSMCSLFLLKGPATAATGFAPHAPERLCVEG